MWHGHGPLSGRRSPDVFPLSVGWASPWRSGPSGHGFPPPGYASLRGQWTRRHPWNWAEPPGPWASAAPPSGRTPFCHSCKEQQRMEMKRNGWKNSVVGPLGGKLFFLHFYLLWTNVEWTFYFITSLQNIVSLLTFEFLLTNILSDFTVFPNTWWVFFLFSSDGCVHLKPLDMN